MVLGRRPGCDRLGVGTSSTPELGFIFDQAFCLEELDLLLSLEFLSIGQTQSLSQEKNGNN